MEHIEKTTRKPRVNLTNLKVKSLPAPAKGQVLHWDSVTRNLGIRITAAGSRSWIVQKRVNGKSVRVTLGPFEVLAVEEARKRADKMRLDMLDGKNPHIERRKQKAQSETLREVMEDYLEHKPLRPASKQDIIKCVIKFFPDWADKPVTTITRDGVIKRFRESSKTAPMQTNLAFRNLRALLYWAREKNATDDGTYPILGVNPVTLAFKKGGLVKWNKEEARSTRIPKDKIHTVWEVLVEHGDPERNIATTCTAADLIAFMLLTGSRIGEARSLEWENVKLDDDPPTFHLAVTKNHHPITLPVSTTLHALLTRRQAARLKGNDYVFPSARKGKGYMTDPRAMFEKVSEAAGEHIHPHALRRTFDDVALVCGVDADQRRQLLNHLASDIHGQHYANDPDPATLMPAAERIGNWIAGDES